MTNHPYPQKIVDEIADYLKPYTASRIEAGSLAHQVLRRVWKASQVDSADDMPDETVLRGKTGFVYEKWPTGWHQSEPYEPVKLDPEDFPSHVIYWGDADE